MSGDADEEARAVGVPGDGGGGAERRWALLAVAVDGAEEGAFASGGEVADDEDGLVDGAVYVRQLAPVR
ncbi:MAG: hypothetical protein IPK33_06430 [Gemmatimonadetes bacterium]|nr:hypothetical protein [Gemmatimonadota bacterium]